MNPVDDLREYLFDMRLWGASAFHIVDETDDTLVLSTFGQFWSTEVKDGQAHKSAARELGHGDLWYPVVIDKSDLSDDELAFINKGDAR